ncbi:cold shock domain protein CspD [Streptomyces agglomeratus]|uniref:Cold shock domain protein CspD n=1 Tax=Streptomyces agglomeratus TaxID=285458 RepID=A0A1E5PFZ7_9ACTN|nr:cold-shock protein [Streptomyces agglomeratus]OEJ28478.1 cold shock domain protein CspD [Streptomyces agglomeratus]OEJ50001.1 cold shock domain protein CspD [Streptomyces agglomeratus]
MATGTVKWFNAAKGFGFIEQTDGAEVFAHFSHIADRDLFSLLEGQKVHFDVMHAARAPYAENIVTA